MHLADRGQGDQNCFTNVRKDDYHQVVDIQLSQFFLTSENVARGGNRNLSSSWWNRSYRAVYALLETCCLIQLGLLPQLKFLEISFGEQTTGGRFFLS